jgi:hypothetical protein
MTMSAILIFSPVGASAITIDFESAQNDYYDIVPGVNMSISAYGGPLTWDSSDKGLGIDDDEIGSGEAMLFYFSRPIYISSFQIVDLFPSENRPLGELGLYSWFLDIDNYGINESFGSGDANGDFNLELNTALQLIAFYTNGEKVNDYGVAGVSAAPVPEPGTIVLMGLGLVGLAGMGRKKLFRK